MGLRDRFRICKPIRRSGLCRGSFCGHDARAGRNQQEGLADFMARSSRPGPARIASRRFLLGINRWSSHPAGQPSKPAVGAARDFASRDSQNRIGPGRCAGENEGENEGQLPFSSPESRGAAAGGAAVWLRPFVQLRAGFQVNRRHDSFLVRCSWFLVWAESGTESEKSGANKVQSCWLRLWPDSADAGRRPCLTSHYSSGSL